jgi:hypothetical protein
LIRNYVDQPVFADAAGAALLASVSYRYAALGLGYSTLDYANAAYQSITASLNASGAVEPVVDPLSYTRELPVGEVSPEAQGFVLLMEASLRDWRANNITTSAKGPTDYFPPRSGTDGLRAGAVLATMAMTVALAVGLL